MAENYTKERVLAHLNEMGISYEAQEHGAVHTMEDVDRAGVRRRGVVLKNLFLKDGKGRRHFLVSVPETKAVDLRSLGERLGVRKLGLASVERLETYLGVEHGCVSPAGLLNDDSRAVTAVFDRSLDGNAIVGIHPNDTTASVWLSFQDVVRIVRAHGNEIVMLDFPEQEQ